MSKEIDLTKKLSEFDLRYLVSRDRWTDIRTNARNLGIDEPPMPNKRDIRAQRPKVGVNARKRDDTFEAIAKALGVKREGAEETTDDSGEQAPDEPTKVNYKKMTVPQLKEELDKRRAEYEEQGDAEAVEEVSYEPGDVKDDLVYKLEEDDKAASAEGNTGN